MNINTQYIIMKSKKLNLSDLKVKSFITEVEGKSPQTVKGGWGNFPTNGSPNANICEDTIFPDQSICDPACLTNFPIFC